MWLNFFQFFFSFLSQPVILYYSTRVAGEHLARLLPICHANRLLARRPGLLLAAKLCLWRPMRGVHAAVNHRAKQHRAIHVRAVAGFHLRGAVPGMPTHSCCGESR